MASMKKKSTPYDDVYRTMMNDCITLLITLVNEVFGKYYTGNEKIVFHGASIINHKILVLNKHIK